MFYPVQSLPVARPDKRPTRVSACAVDSVGSVDTSPDAVESLLEPCTLKDAFDHNSSPYRPSSCTGNESALHTNDQECCIPHTDFNTNLSEAFSPYIDADEFHVRSYVDVNIERLPSQAALIDGGSEICCINETLIQNLNVPVHKQVRISGLNQQSDLVNVVRLHANPVIKEPHLVNIAPSVCFAVVSGLHEAVVLTPNVVSLLNNVACYNVLAPCPSTEGIGGDLVNLNDADCDTDNIVSLPQTDTYEQMFTEPEINVAGKAIAFLTQRIPVLNPLIEMVIPAL